MRPPSTETRILLTPPLPSSFAALFLQLAAAIPKIVKLDGTRAAFDLVVAAYAVARERVRLIP